MTALNYKNEDGVAQLTLDNPPQNRFAPEVFEGMADAVADLSSRADTRVLLIKSNGPDFSWGGDIRVWRNVNSEEFGANVGQALSLVNALESLPFPVVVAVQGHCRGGGFELALRGDIIIAAEDAKFGHSEATIGIFTLLGGVQRVADRVGRTRAFQFAATSEMVSAQQALEIGLINEVAGVDELDVVTDKWVNIFATGATLAHGAHKKLLNARSNGGLVAADLLMPGLANQLHASADVQENLAAAVEAVNTGKPRPVFKFKGK